MTSTISQNYESFRSRKYFSSLDGLRAISILAVIWYHVPELRPLWRTGYLGVHLFFVISGFLITTLLLREKAKAGAISLRNFYIRRTLRIFPAYYLTLILFLLLCYIVPELHREALPTYVHNLPSFLTYTSNWFVYPWGPGHVVFVAAWSLATEEQFYLFWPWIIKYARKWYTPVIVMLLLIAGNEIVKLVAGYQFFLTGYALPILIINSVSTAICFGCLLAIALDNKKSFAVFWKLLGQRWSAPLFFAVTVIVCCNPNDDILLVGHMFLVTLSMMLLVGACTIRDKQPMRALLANPVMSYIGMISYGLYLYHAFGLNLADRLCAWAKPYPALYFLLVTGFTVVLATLSYYIFEKRFLNLKECYTRIRNSPADPIAKPVLAAD